MKDCPTPDKLQQFVADELDQSSGAELEAHLRDCLSCQEKIDGFSDDPELRNRCSHVRQSKSKGAYDEWHQHLTRWYATSRETTSSSATHLAESLPPLEQLGRFRIERRLGVGGFGIVYLAHDPKLHRKVALKIPHPRALAAPGSRKRFLREARAAAALNHPNIITVFETQEAGETCYLISTFCRGGTLAEFLDRGVEPLTPRQAATLIAILANAVHYAHECGVLHCDLKPGNVMLQPLDDATTLSNSTLPFVPLLTDFGLARFLERPVDDSSDADSSDAGSQLLTGLALGAGTPGYMAPEQVHGRSHEVGRATDVYALGAILYELLTGEAPFRGKTRREILDKLLSEEVVPPRKIRRAIPRDLEAICLKCLEKRSSRRYPTAADLREDLTRFLRDEPTEARPLAMTQRLVRWVRRNPASAGILAISLTTVVAIVIGLTIHSYKLKTLASALQASLQREALRRNEVTQEKSRAEQSELTTRRQAYVSQMWRVSQMYRNRQIGNVCTILNQQRPDAANQRDFRGFEWYYLWHLGTNLTDLQTEPGGAIYRLSFSPDGELCATATYPLNHEPMVWLWNVRTRSVIDYFPGGDGCFLGFSADPKCLMLAKSEGLIESWDLGTRQLKRKQSPAFVYATLSPDGKLMAYTTLQDGEPFLHLWDVDAERQRTISPPFLLCPESELRFTANSQFLVAGRHQVTDSKPTPHSGLAWIDTATGQILREYPASQACFKSLDATADGNLLIMGSWHGFLNVINQSTGEMKKATLADSKISIRAAVTPNGQLIAAAPVKDNDVQRPDAMQDVRFLNPHTLEPTTTRISTLGEVLRVLEFSPKNDLLALGGRNGFLRFLNVPQHEAFATWNAGHHETWSIALLSRGESLLTTGDDHVVRVWNLATKTLQQEWQGHSALIAAAAVSRDGQSVVTGSFDKTARLWDAKTGTTKQTLTGHQKTIRCVCFTPDGSLVATGSDDQRVKIWQAADGKLLQTLDHHQDKIRAVAFLSDNQRLLSASNDGTVILWDTRSGSVIKRWVDTSEVHSLAVLAQQDRFATGNKEGAIRLYRVDRDESQTILDVHVGEVRALAFSSDGRTLAFGGEDNVVKLLQVSSGEELMTLPGTQSQINDLEFSSDDNLLAAACHDGTVTIWRAPR